MSEVKFIIVGYHIRRANVSLKFVSKGKSIVVSDLYSLPPRIYSKLRYCLLLWFIFLFLSAFWNEKQLHIP